MSEFTFKAEINNNEIVFLKDSVFYDTPAEIDRDEFYTIVNYTMNMDADEQEDIPNDVFKEIVFVMIEDGSNIELSREEYIEAKSFEV